MNPPVPEIAPENVVDVLLPPAVSVALPNVMEPAPAIDPAACAKLFRLKVAPDATVMSDVAAIRLAAPNVSVPALTIVGPEYVLAPDRVIPRGPIFVRPLPLGAPPVPLMTPLKVVEVLFPPVVSVPAPSETPPPVVPPPAREPIVSALPFSARETPAVFAKVTADISAIALPPSKLSVPPLTVVVPV